MSDSYYSNTWIYRHLMGLRQWKISPFGWTPGCAVIAAFEQHAK